MSPASSARPPGTPALPLEVLPETLAICRLPARALLPAWADPSSAFLTVSWTAEELSITTVQHAIPAGLPCERDYRALRVRGPLPLDLIGILAATGSSDWSRHEAVQGGSCRTMLPSRSIEPVGNSRKPGSVQAWLYDLAVPGTASSPGPSCNPGRRPAAGSTVSAPNVTELEPTR